MNEGWKPLEKSDLRDPPVTSVTRDQRLGLVCRVRKTCLVGKPKARCLVGGYVVPGSSSRVWVVVLGPELFLDGSGDQMGDPWDRVSGWHRRLPHCETDFIWSGLQWWIIRPGFWLAMVAWLMSCGGVVPESSLQ